MGCAQGTLGTSVPRFSQLSVQIQVVVITVRSRCPCCELRHPGQIEVFVPEQRSPFVPDQALAAAGRRGDVEAGRGAFVAPGVARQRLVNAEPRWGPDGAGNAAENLSQGQLRPSALRAPGPRTLQAQPPAPEQAPQGARSPAAQAFMIAVFPVHIDLFTTLCACKAMRRDITLLGATLP